MEDSEKESHRVEVSDAWTRFALPTEMTAAAAKQQLSRTWPSLDRIWDVRWMAMLILDFPWPAGGEANRMIEGHNHDPVWSSGPGKASR